MVLGGLLSLANWLGIFQSNITKRFHSPVPLIGAILLGTGMLLNPTARPYAWTALFLDWGTLALLISLPWLIRDFWKTSRFNLLYEYLGKAGMKTVHLNLFKRGIFTIRIQLSRPPGEAGLVGTGTTGTWKREETRLLLSAWKNETAIFDVNSKDSVEVLQQFSGFESWEKNSELSLASIELIQTKNCVA